MQVYGLRFLSGVCRTSGPSPCVALISEGLALSLLVRHTATPALHPHRTVRARRDGHSRRLGVQIRASASHSLPSGIRTALGSGKSLQGPVLLAIAYYLGAEAAFFVGTLSDKIFAPFWPPNVILFCVLLLVPQKRWWMYIAAAFPAHVIAELGVGMPTGQLIVAFVTNCCVALINAIAVRRIIGDPPWFSGLRKASSYVLI